MKNTVKKELAQHVIDLIEDGVLTDENFEDRHFHAFNEDYYMIGYYDCSEWLKAHDIGEFEASGICQQYEIDNFGESKVYDNSESVVNMLAYIYGEDLLYSVDANNVDDLKEEMESFI